MSSRWTGFFVWALVAACAAFWGIRIFAATRAVPLGAQAPQTAIAAAGPMERLFGAVVVPVAAAPVQHPESERFQLVGVIAPREGGDARDGLAIVTIDGQPAKSWRVGATLDGQTTLLAVTRRGAQFGPRGGPSAFTLELPQPTAAATGTLPNAQAQLQPGDQFGQPGVLQAPTQAEAPHIAQPPMPAMMRGNANPGFTQRGAGAQAPAIENGQVPPQQQLRQNPNETD